MLRVRDIMTCDIAALTPEATIREAMEMLYTGHLSGAPVLRGGSVVGVISMTDVADLLVNGPEPVTIDGDSLLDERTVEDAMSRDLISVSPDASVKSAATLMRKRGVHRVLVMDDDRLAGIVSSLDIARAVSERGVMALGGVSRDPCCDDPSPWITI